MPLYAFKGVGASGKTVSGTREADGPKNLRQVLKRESVFITEMREVQGREKQGGRQAAGGGTKQSGLKKDIDFKGLFETIRPADVAIFTRQLATLLRAGIPLAEALAALSEQSDNKKLQMVLAELRQRVNEGEALAKALEVHPRVFPDLYVNMVRSGETAGNLDVVLLRLADFMETQNALRAKVSGAMTYPIIMMVMGSLVMGILMVVVVPQITEIFADSQRALPFNTQILIGVSSLVGGWWFILLPAIVGAVIMVRRWMRTPKGRGKVDRWLLKTPVVGPLVRFLAVARFARTLATMLASGVPVLTALDIVKRVLNNTVLEKVVEEARDSIREGESVAAPLKRSGQFPSMMCHMVAVGERSGELETMLEHVADAYERDVESKVARLTALLSPLMIVVMAVGVGFIVFSIIQPILDLQQFVQ
ncbi:MAG: type II secretion system inner membrane protein GspF [Deltaproteobacteria bacterium]|nr:type II secretion system inner membrane protein GspF [Deltaproteobacteria bacterium]